MLLVKAKLIGDKYRLVDSFTDKIVYKRNGEPWDSGGHANITTAIQQASNINAGVEKDKTLPRGKDGEKGSAGAPGRDGRSIVWRGQYSPNATYAQYEIVKYEGAVWIWISQEPGNAPVRTSKSWDLFVDRGEPGLGGGGSGPTGPQGVAGQGVPAGGTTNQILSKSTNDDYDTEWVDAAGVSLPLSYSVMARLTANESDVTGDGTVYIIGGTSGFTELVDDRTIFNASTGVATMEDDGVYAISCLFIVDNMFGRTGVCKGVVAGGSFANEYLADGELLEVSGEGMIPQKIAYRLNFSAPMSIGDTFHIEIAVSGGAKTVDVLSADSYLTISSVQIWP